MDMDIDELVEHPQWQELISTALYHVTKKRRDSGGINDELKSLCIRFITRLAIGLPGPQVCCAHILWCFFNVIDALILCAITTN